jgi:RNA-splicing ligase RtcB
MFELEGKYGKAKVYADNVEQSAVSQIILLLNQPFAEGANVCIMPDVHAGAGCVIGFTAKVTDKIIPNLIGVDIGCGVSSVLVGNNIPSLSDIDRFFQAHIPTGFHKRENSIYDDYFQDDYGKMEEICAKTNQNFKDVRLSLGTLGGGNHFAEIEKGGRGNWFTVHTGSRNFGLKIALHYQKLAQSIHPEVPKELAYLDGELALEYLDAMKIAQTYAIRNREAIIDDMLDFLGTSQFRVNSIHNYIDTEKGFIRKGAISAYEDEEVVIPLNMRDGIILGYGKGNADWNFSAPHGAGRIMSRSQAKKELSLSEFEDTMKGVYSSCVSKDTLDESPMAYKESSSIIATVSDTVEIIEIALPIWNAKGI